jgi:hypothetical protein
MLVGASDLAEIAIICAAEAEVRLVGIVDPKLKQERFHALPVWSRLQDAEQSADAVIITSLEDTHDVYERAVKVFGEERVLVPALLAPTLALPTKRIRERA